MLAACEQKALGLTGPQCEGGVASSCFLRRTDNIYLRLESRSRTLRQAGARNPQGVVLKRGAPWSEIQMMIVYRVGPGGDLRLLPPTWAVLSPRSVRLLPFAVAVLRCPVFEGKVILPIGTRPTHHVFLWRQRSIEPTRRWRSGF